MHIVLSKHKKVKREEEKMHCQVTDCCLGSTCRENLSIEVDVSTRKHRSLQLATRRCLSKCFFSNKENVDHQV